MDIFEVAKIYQIPKSPPYISGLVNNRGRIIPVFDIREALSIEEKKTITHVIITSLNNTLIGLAAESCPSIITIETFTETKDKGIIKGEHDQVKIVDLELIIEKYKI